MRITIEYDSCWQTSFLGDDIKKPISENNKLNQHASQGYKQKFVATTKTKGDTPAPITKSTIIGILCRLIGEQRKLYQIKASGNYYFTNIEDKIDFDIVKEKSTEQELMYLTNKSENRCGQSNYLGVLGDDNPWFFSKNSVLLWSVLYLNKNQLLDFLLQTEPCELANVDCRPTALIARLNLITDSKHEYGAVYKSKNRLLSEKKEVIAKEEKKIKLFEEKVIKKPPITPKQIEKSQDKLNELNNILNKMKVELKNIEDDKEIQSMNDRLIKAIKKLSDEFFGNEYWKDGVVYPYRLYSVALYMQANRLLAKNVELDFVKNDKGDIQIQGFSKRGFNGTRDWFNSMTGGRKKAVGTPCIVQKQSGRLEIVIDISKSTAKELKQLIENAGVSSFYLGKKGLAYVTNISTKEVN